MSTFEPHWEALPATQRELWPQLAGSIDLGLVLYGGTAVALRLGHRNSIDFDFFTERALDREELRQRFSFLDRSKVIQEQENTLSLLVPVQETSVKVSFFGDIGTGRAGSPERTPDGVLEVASLLDLLASKLKVIQQRIEAKDYRDVAALLQAGGRLETGLAVATAQYGGSFQPSEAVKALTYFEGGDLSSLALADRQVLVRSVTNLRSIPIAGLVSRALSSFL